MTTRTQLVGAFDALLQPDRFKDYGPNGLQVEGRGEILRLASGVTASLALIKAAVQWKADAVLVHHGLFWRGQTGTVTGWMKQRLALLLSHDINLLAYHLPLDAHPEYGNNAQLGQRLGLEVHAHFGEQALGFLGSVQGADSGVTIEQLVQRIEAVVQRAVTLVPGDGRRLQRVAWCTGGAQGYFESAIAAGADVYITGEISEPQAHYARESGIAFIACGHHASERYGAAATASHVAAALGLQHQFFDIDNPA